MPEPRVSADFVCLVISPIGDRHAAVGTDDRRRFEESAEIWEYVIEPACQQFGIEPLRADQMTAPGEIPEQVFELLRDADLVIADVTGGNANVMYELGLRHTRDRCTIQLGQRARLPFDINVIRTIQFRRTDAGLPEARRALEKMIAACLEGNFRRVTATRLWAAPEGEAREERGLDEEAWKPEDKEPPGLIDVLGEGETALVELSEVLERAGTIIRRIGELADDATREIEQADARGQGFAARIVIARKFAAQLGEPASELEELGSSYVERIEKVSPAVTILLNEIAEQETREPEAESLLDSILMMAAESAESMDSLRTLATSMTETADLSRDLRPTTRRIERALNTFADATEATREWAARVEVIRSGASGGGGEVPAPDPDPDPEL